MVKSAPIDILCTLCRDMMQVLIVSYKSVDQLRRSSRLIPLLNPHALELHFRILAPCLSLLLPPKLRIVYLQTPKLAS